MDRQNSLMAWSFGLSVGLLWLWLGSIHLAVGLLVLIFVHEMGHYLAARQKNIKVTPPIFLGPLGALINMQEQPKSASDEAYMAFAGPLLGTLGGIVAIVVGHMLGVPALFGLAKWAFMLNLFNLIPLAPLDGGRISMAMDRRLWVLGLPLLLVLLWTSWDSTFSVIVIMMVLSQAFQDIRTRGEQAAANPAYFDVGFKTRVSYALAYLALGGFLYWAMSSPLGLVSLMVKLGL